MTVFFAVLCLLPSLYAQQNWQWGKRVEIMVNDMTVDNQGNVYVTWDLNHTENIDGHIIQPFTTIYPSITLTNAAVTSFSCDGSYRWTKVIGGGYYCVADQITVDSMGGVYFACYSNMDPTYTYDTLVHIGNDTSLNPQRLEKGLMFIKLDTSGNFEWLRMPEPDMSGLNENAGVMDISFSPSDGLLYLISLLPPGAYADGAFQATYPYVNNADTFFGSPFYVLKYDRFGNFQSGLHLSFSFCGPVFSDDGFKRDPTNGRYYVSGHFSNYGDYRSALFFGNSDSTSKAQYLGVFDSTGAFLWMRQNARDTIHGGNGNPGYVGQGGSIAFDKAGNIYFTGGTNVTDSWGGHALTIDTITGYMYTFLLKFSPQGEVLNATNAIEYGFDYGRAIAYSNNIVSLSMGLGWDLKWGNVEATRPHSDQGADALMARFNAANLEAIGLEHIKSSNYANEYGTVLATDNKGSFYMGGTFDGAMYIGPDTIYNQSSNGDGFIAKFGFANCNCNPPAAHFSYGSLQQPGNISLTYDGAQPVDSVIWNFGDGSSSTSISNFNIQHSFPQSGNYMVCAIAYNSCGSNMYCEELAIGNVGIDDIPGFANIHVYPNPATQMLNIEGASSGTELDIYDALGRQMLQTTLSGTRDKVEVNQLPSGIYIMRFIDKNGRRGNVKFVKE